MAILLPFLSGLALYASFARRSFISRREACLAALVVCGMWAWAVTELLSFFRLLNAVTVGAAWSLLFSAVLLWLRKGGLRLSQGRETFQAVLSSFVPRLRFAFSVRSPVDLLIFSGVLIILAGTLFLALVSPPNTWDALTYHMARVAHWAQNGTVAPYPTNIPRQVFSHPGQEYFILHVYLLAGGDLFVNLVQWTAMAGSLIAASLIARDLGASARGQYFSAVIAAAIPMGILQSNSVQGDYTVSFFLAAGVHWFLRWRREPGLWNAAFCGMALALMTFSKGTGVFFVIPLVVWMFGKAWIERSARRGRQVLLCLLLIAGVNSGFALRNIAAFPGAALSEATAENRAVLNEKFTAGIFVINLLRNAGMHMGTSLPQLNEALTRGAYGAAGALGLDLNDPCASFTPYRFEFQKASLSEDDARNAFHFILFMLLTVLMACSGIRGDVRKLWWLLLAMAAVFALFVKWQPWVSRLQLPLFVMASAWAAVVLERAVAERWRAFFILVLIVMALPYLVNGWPRRLLGKKTVLAKAREEIYFMQNKPLYAECAAEADRIARAVQGGCRDIGIVIGSDSWEYPFFPLLKARGARGFRLEHVVAGGPFASVPYPLGDFRPCLIVDRR